MTVMDMSQFFIFLIPVNSISAFHLLRLVRRVLFSNISLSQNQIVEKPPGASMSQDIGKHPGPRLFGLHRNPYHASWSSGLYWRLWRSGSFVFNYFAMSEKQKVSLFSWGGEGEQRETKCFLGSQCVSSSKQKKKMK